MFNRVGGLKEDLPLGWLDRASAAVGSVRAQLPGISAVLDNELFRSRTVGVGVLPRPVAEEYGVSGPVARASGLDLDLRRDEPYLAYEELTDLLRGATHHDGDAFSRFACLLDEITVSLDLVDATSAAG